jgi:hypothetical protein
MNADRASTSRTCRGGGEQALRLLKNVTRELRGDSLSCVPRGSCRVVALAAAAPLTAHCPVPPAAQPRIARPPATHPCPLLSPDLYLGATIDETDTPPEPASFVRNFVGPNKPLIIRGGAAHWPALSKWTRAYLQRAAGDAVVSVDVTPNGRGDAVTRLGGCPRECPQTCALKLWFTTCPIATTAQLWPHQLPPPPLIPSAPPPSVCRRQRTAVLLHTAPA